jgi:Calpain family cysteine protease
MGCSTKGSVEGPVRDKETRRSVGILSGHAYAINDVFELPGKEGKRDFHRLLRLKNPQGDGQVEWNGKWSDNSEEVQLHADALKAYNEDLEKNERFVVGKDDGTFLINYQEWREYFNRFFCAIDFEDSWNAIRFESKWTAKTSGGCPDQQRSEKSCQ